MKERVKGIFATCDLHVNRLRWALNYIEPLMPVTVEKLAAFSPVEITVFELFSNRFSKLLDLMSIKLFPSILELIEEPNPPVVFIDILNRLEKLGILPSANQWIEFRHTRNSFTHDYPDDSQENANALNKSFIYAAELLNILANIKKFTMPFLTR